MTTAFSSDGEAVLTRRVDPAPSSRSAPARSEDQILSYYEIERCIQFIANHGCSYVACQFPDSLLCDAARVTCLLQQATKASVFVLGDTSYGSCCVDEVAAEHMLADCIIHFGPACLTQTKRLPLLYIFGAEEIDTDNCVAAFRSLFPAREDHILVLYDTVFYHCIEQFKEMVQKDYPNCEVSDLNTPDTVPISSTSSTSHPKAQCGCFDSSKCDQTETEGHASDCCCRAVAAAAAAAAVSLEEVHISKHSSGGLSIPEGTEVKTDSHQSYKRFGRRFRLHQSMEQYKVYYIGSEGPTLSNLMLNYNKSQFYSYNPVGKQGRKESINVNKALGRRYFLVQKAKEARTVGILIGTLGAGDYMGIIDRLKHTLNQAGKKYYTIAVGKLNPAKMANFMEIDIFVLVACPENSLIDSQEFYKPVVTPYEMEVACLRAREWTGQFVTDYQELFPGAAFYVPVGESADHEAEPKYSLITGDLLPTFTSQETSPSEDPASNALVPRNKMELALQDSPGAEYLRNRSWQGLERKLGETSVSTAVEGRTGIAASYTHES